MKGAVAGDFGFDNLKLGSIDTAFLSLYAIGQFVNGVVGDRVGGRLLVGLGLLATAALNLLFGFGRDYSLFLVVYGNAFPFSADPP